MLAILAKRFILDAWLGPDSASAGEYNTFLKIQTEMSRWQQVKMASL